MSPMPKCQALHIVGSCMDKFLYETRVLASYIQFKVKLPTSDSTEITAGGPKIILESPVPLDAPWQKNIFVLNASRLLYHM